MVRTPIVRWLLKCLTVCWPAVVWAQESNAPDYDSREWYWQWGTMLIVAGAIVVVCLKNPKRTHDN